MLTFLTGTKTVYNIINNSIANVCFWVKLI